MTGLAANRYYHINVTDANGYIGTNPSGGTTPYNYTWSNGATSQMITDLDSGNYSIRITDRNGCEEYASFDIRSAVPFEEEKICIVTVDILTGHNLVIWEKSPNRGIGSYNIYREDVLIGNVPYDNSSL